MKEHPILFSSEMVRAILDGRKTQTRRTNGLEDVNNYPGKLSGESFLGELGYKGLDTSDYYIKNKRDYAKNSGLYHWFLGEQTELREINPIPVKCTYGQPGDRLWVRETWMPFTEAGVLLHEAIYKATDKPEPDEDIPLRWRPSIFMPRWASRITLEVVNVRVERVQDISLSETETEGIHYFYSLKGICSANPPDPRWKFIELWDSINAKRGYGWEINPFVWVIEFKRVEA